MTSSLMHFHSKQDMIPPGLYLGPGDVFMQDPASTRSFTVTMLLTCRLKKNNLS